MPPLLGGATKNAKSGSGVIATRAIAPPGPTTPIKHTTTRNGATPATTHKVVKLSTTSKQANMTKLISASTRATSAKYRLTTNLESDDEDVEMIAEESNDDEVILVPSTQANSTKDTDQVIRGRTPSRLSMTSRSASAPPRADSGEDTTRTNLIDLTPTDFSTPPTLPVLSTADADSSEGTDTNADNGIDDILMEVVELDPKDFATQPTISEATATTPALPTGIRNSRWATANAEVASVTPQGAMSNTFRPRKSVQPSATKAAAARELVTDCLAHLQLAAQLDPHLEDLLRLAESSVKGYKHTKLHPNSNVSADTQKPTKATTSYADVASGASNGPAIISYTTSSTKGFAKPQQYSTRAPGNTTHNQDPTPRRFAVLESRGTHPDPTPLECIKLRDNINKSLGAQIVAEARVSIHHNLVLFPVRGTPVADILTHYSKWRHVLLNAYHEPYVPDQWIKLIAHGVPSFLDQQGPLAESFTHELSFSQIKVKGTPYWLNAPTNKQAGSVCFAVATSAEADQALRGLRIASVFCKVVKKAAFTNTTKCFRCQGVGHNPRICRRQPTKSDAIPNNNLTETPDQQVPSYMLGAQFNDLEPTSNTLMTHTAPVTPLSGTAARTQDLW